MKAISIGQFVWVPARRIGVEHETVSALVQKQVVNRAARTVTIQATPARQEQIATKLVHPSVGVAIFRIGDMTSSEQILLDPLARSVLQYSRLLLTDDLVRLFEVRSLKELSHFWHQHHGEFRHIILVGHGDNNSILFGREKVSSSQLSETIFLTATEMKVVVSLCCNTGRASFAKQFSNRQRAEAFIAPLNSVHGADASTFIQLFLCQSLLDGATTATAFKRAERGIGVERNFKMWKHGEMTKFTK